MWCFRYSKGCIFSGRSLHESPLWGFPFRPLFSFDCLVQISFIQYLFLCFSSQGCTATVLLVWADGDENFFAQCANVGDSACVLKYVSCHHPSLDSWITCHRKTKVAMGYLNQITSYPYYFCLSFILHEILLLDPWYFFCVYKKNLPQFEVTQKVGDNKNFSSWQCQYLLSSILIILWCEWEW